MSFPSLEVWTKVEIIEVKLAELDPIMQNFCNRRGFHFSKMVDENKTLWPRRGMWKREDIDRCIYLTMDLTVAEVIERGFYPEMPWSLHADATLPAAICHPPRILSTNIFNSIPYHRLGDILDKGLEDGLTILGKLTQDDVLTKGKLV